MSEAAGAFWQRYLDSLPAQHRHRSARLDAFAFGDTPEFAAELAALVAAGRKRATASLPAEFTALGLPLPAEGDVGVVTLADGTPVAVIELIDVRQVPFESVDAAFAAEEGEGDGSLAFWRAAHQAYFERVVGRLGGKFDGRTPVLCQRFRVVWRSSTS